MGKFKDKLYRFAYGRYGTDTLNKVLTWIYFIWIIAAVIISLFWDSIWFTLLNWTVSLVLMIWIFSRMLSRNIAKRQRENAKFCGFFKLRKNKFKDRKTHVYRKCPKCRAVLRLPKAKGKHFVVCPACKNRFEVKG